MLIRSRWLRSRMKIYTFFTDTNPAFCTVSHIISLTCDYHIHLQLKAEIVVNGLPELFAVAVQMSEPLVVRGRCPLSFRVKDSDDHTRGRKPREKGRHGNKGTLTRQSQKE